MSLDNMKRVLDEVKAERIRQILQEGHCLDHDDRHCRGELAQAAACYAHVAGHQSQYEEGETAQLSRLLGPVTFWPWERSWWHPALNRRRNLLKAAALIVAELERLDRQAGRK